MKGVERREGEGIKHNWEKKVLDELMEEKVKRRYGEKKEKYIIQTERSEREWEKSKVKRTSWKSKKYVYN